MRLAERIEEASVQKESQLKDILAKLQRYNMNSDEYIRICKLFSGSKKSLDLLLVLGDWYCNGTPEKHKEFQELNSAALKSDELPEQTKFYLAAID